MTTQRKQVLSCSYPKKSEQTGPKSIFHVHKTDILEGKHTSDDIKEIKENVQEETAEKSTSGDGFFFSKLNISR